ncbi:MAG: hypothetical protein M0C28_06110 [Candidatus Moduliflexus flocculans]|nr:hypothetical protein [Candidatus Moduliflexus flocculans]
MRPTKKKAASPTQIVPLSSGALAIEALQVGNIYPVFFKYYNDHPIGTHSLVANKGGKRSRTSP